MKKQLAYVLVAGLMGIAPRVLAKQPESAESPRPSLWTLGAAVFGTANPDISFFSFNHSGHHSSSTGSTSSGGGDASGGD